MERLESFGGGKSEGQPINFETKNKELENLITKASGIKELLEIIEKAGGIARSDGKIISSARLNEFISDLLQAKADGMKKDGMAVKMLLEKITRNAGLRDKVEKIIFG